MDENNFLSILYESLEEEDPPSTTNIMNLNDDCLTNIFQRLSILDRLRLERVCKRWQCLLKSSWNDFYTLSFNNKDWGFKEPSDLETVNSKNLEQVLKRCGPYVFFVHFDVTRTKVCRNVFGTIANYCPNLVSIFAPNIKFKPESVRILAEKCCKLDKFLFGSSTKDCDEELAMLFRRNRDLRAVYIGSNRKVTGECLSALNADKIKTIFFDNCVNLSLKYFRVCKNFKNLVILVLNHFHDISNEAAEDISQCFPNLQEFIITATLIFPFSPAQMTKLSNIVILSLAGNYTITDDLLVAVGNNCKTLKKVDISSCHSITNRGIAAILSLPELTTLTAEMLNAVDGQVFNCAPNLVELKCNFCVNMRDDGIAKLIKYSHNIENIYLVGCEKISSRLIKSAIRHTKRRGNDIVLNIHVTEGQINLDEITDSSPLLKIVEAKVIHLHDHDDEDHHHH